MILNLHRTSHKQYHSPFKFINSWADRDNFFLTVRSIWQKNVRGNPMYQLTTKHQLLKAELRKFHRLHTNHISCRVAKAKADWNGAQTRLDQNPTADENYRKETEQANLYMQLYKDEESFFKQRFRIQWLQLGDRNTSFFHKSLLHIVRSETKSTVSQIKMETLFLTRKN